MGTPKPPGERTVLPKQVRATLCAACLAVLGTELRAELPRSTSRDEPSGAVVYPLHDTPAASSLNGNWRFHLVAEEDAPVPAGFETASFDDSGWATIEVPGHWDLAGFIEPRYTSPEPATGFYRTSFEVDPAWRGRRVHLRFEGVLMGFDAWLNGTPVGSWGSAYNPVTFDITDLVDWSGENSLSVRVTSNNFGRGFDLNDCWGLAGIYREVWLFALPDPHIHDWSIDTRIEPDGSARARVQVNVSREAEADTGLHISGALDGATLVFTRSETDALTAEYSVPAAQLWNAEAPVRTPVVLSLHRGDTVVHELSDQVALREVRVEGRQLLVNGRAIKLRGVNHHNLWPDTGRALTARQIERDLELVIAANANFLRTAHYPPDHRLIEACEELGLYVMCEVPFGFGDEFLDEPASEPELVARAEATLRRDAHRGAIIIWSIGNENPLTPHALAAGRRVKDLDTTRPISFPQMGAYFHDNHERLPGWVDVYTPHYPTTERLLDYRDRLTDRPFIFTEYAHQLGTGGDNMEAHWEIMQRSPGFTGGALWLLNDQGVLRRASPSVRPHDLAIHLDERHYYDTDGDHGADGLTYSDRTPKTNYWQTMAAYSPIVLAGHDLASDGTLEVILENRHNFLDLGSFTGRWTLHVAGSPPHGGTFRPGAAPDARETITLELPAIAAGADAPAWVELAIANTSGRRVFFCSIPLVIPRVEPALAEADVRAAESLAETLSSRESGFQLRVGRPLGLVELARINRSSEEDLYWQPYLLPMIEHSPENAAEARVRFERIDRPGQTVAGTIRSAVDGDDAIRVAYDLEAENAGGIWPEAGLTFAAPAGVTELHWIGRGPYPAYPGKEALSHFGRHSIHADDLHFSGNRRQVAAAVLCDAAGDGIALLADDAPFDLSIERSEDGVLVGHNAAVSSPGNKFEFPEILIEPAKAPRLEGRFRIVPVRRGAWPEPLRTWFDLDRPHPVPFRPFVESRQ